MARGLHDEREQVSRPLGRLPSDVEDLPPTASEAMVSVLVGLFREPAEVEPPTVGLDTEPQRRKGQVQDPDESVAAVEHAVLAHKWWQLR